MIDSPTTPHRLPASDRRRQLVETALDLFSRKGFGGTTTKEIAAAAGVNEAIIFRHFPTKQDLYNAVLDYHHETAEIAECMAEFKLFMDRNDDEGLFRSIIERILKAYRKDLRVHRVLLFAALEGHGLDRPVAGQAFASGMAAISSVLMTLTRSGGHVVAPAAAHYNLAVLAKARHDQPRAEQELALATSIDPAVGQKPEPVAAPKTR